MMKNYFYKLKLLVAVGVFTISSEISVGMEKRECTTVEVKVTHYTQHQNQSPEDYINTTRVQLFSITPPDFTKGHEELERLRIQYKTKAGFDIGSYDALLVEENDSKWLRGQLAGLSTKNEADMFATKIDKVLQTGAHTINTGVVSQKGFTLKKAQNHNWN